MRYEALEGAVRQLITTATEADLRAFGAATVARVIEDGARLDLTRADLDERAWLAFREAGNAVPTAGPAELREYLGRIDEGTLADGDMDFPLPAILDALERWTAFLETGRRDELYELAIRSIELVDFQVEADLDDVLATPEMAAEYDRIRRLLTGQR
ncbi:hypothetical protein [Micromonospora auratinigra]|uniref:Uncharacterized protein n=1 Tax=Micromonospora auratinigra TaxID=261654 RepID=A0A1A8ZPA3_9ACTN|nr:hypothetical protein [Micromonospora auratinigra]SBT45723.1 hypothetical protein GA0070611_3122 [Micromonospora auratinigra]